VAIGANFVGNCSHLEGRDYVGVNVKVFGYAPTTSGVGRRLACIVKEKKFTNLCFPTSPLHIVVRRQSRLCLETRTNRDGLGKSVSVSGDGRRIAVGAQQSSAKGAGTGIERETDRQMEQQAAPQLNLTSVVKSIVRPEWILRLMS
jgi:hypothetical protein